jgi:hypothetical protein
MCSASVPCGRDVNYLDLKAVVHMKSAGFTNVLDDSCLEQFCGVPLVE